MGLSAQWLVRESRGQISKQEGPSISSRLYGGRSNPGGRDRLEASAEGQASAVRRGCSRTVWRRLFHTVPAWLLLACSPGPSLCGSINYISQFSGILKF